MAVMRSPLHLPELGLGERRIIVSNHLVAEGDEVREGDRIVEILADSVTVDLSAPAAGTLIQFHVDEDDEVQVGDLLATIEGPE